MEDVDAQLNIVIFGLTLSSSWGNGHATLWRGLCGALARRGHRITFFEKDVPYYAAHRDLTALPGTKLVLYRSWDEVLELASSELSEADAGFVTSYCPDGVAASRLLLSSTSTVRVFYDMDTPVTLERAEQGLPLDYVPPEGLGGFDLVLSYTGGRALTELSSRLGARVVRPLYGSVDPEVHRPVPPVEAYRSQLSYLGTFARDRQAAVEALFVEPARRRPEETFLLAGAQYPAGYEWPKNVVHLEHLPPGEHAALYGSSRLTLNVTRGAMARMGYCPSGRLFEAAACGAPVLSDAWEGIEAFFTPGKEILLTSSSEQTLEMLALSDDELQRVAKAARERTLAEHTADHRAQELETLLVGAAPNNRAPRTRRQRSGISWGIIPAAGAGSRIQPLAFSKELLPVGTRTDSGVERPCAVAEFLLERMIKGGATRINLVVSPGKSDILEYFGGSYQGATLCYTVQPTPGGLCDALFRATPLVHPDDDVLVGLPDTVWFPENGFERLPGSTLSFLLFPVKNPQVFDAVILGERDEVLEIQVKQPNPGSHWVWGAFRMPGHVFHELHRLWLEREQRDEYVGTLVNAWLAAGGLATGVRAGERYVDVGTLPGYREAIEVLANRSTP